MAARSGSTPDGALGIQRQNAQHLPPQVKISSPHQQQTGRAQHAPWVVVQLGVRPQRVGQVLRVESVADCISSVCHRSQQGWGRLRLQRGKGPQDVGQLLGLESAPGMELGELYRPAAGSSEATGLVFRKLLDLQPAHMLPSNPVRRHD